MKTQSITLEVDPRITIRDSLAYPGQRAITCNAKGCRISRHIPELNGPCSCTTVWVLPNGNCPCAPSDNSNPIVLVEE